MTSRTSSSSMKNHEQLKNLASVFPVQDAVYDVIVEFMKKYQSAHNVTFRNDIGSTLEQIQNRINVHPLDSRHFLCRIIFSLSTNIRLSVLMEIRLRLPLCYVMPTKRYEREVNVIYREVLPQIRALWPKDEQPPFAQLCASTHHSSILLLLQDAGELNFPVKTESSPLDLADAEAIMKLLAHFHASSTAIVNAENHFAGLDVETPKTTFDTFDGSIGATYLCNASVAFREHLFPQVREGVQNAFKNFTTNFEKIMEPYYRPSANGLNVLIHGDLRLQNILLCETGPCQFFDFQRSRRGSPALDVVYFLMSSVKIEVVETERESLLSCYLNEFNRVASSVHTGEQYRPEAFQADLLAQKKYVFHELLRTALSWTNRFKESTLSWHTALEEAMRSDEFIRTVQHWLKFLQLE